MNATFLVIAVTVAAPGLKDPPAKEAPSLVGEWAVERITVDGTAKVVPDGTTWAFTADRKSTFTVGRGTVPDAGTYTTDPKADPPAVDIAIGPTGKAMRGRYRVDGDALTLCLTQDGRDRPAGFDAPAESKALLVVLRRAKKD